MRGLFPHPLLANTICLTPGGPSPCASSCCAATSLSGSMQDLLLSLLILVGALFTLIGSLGLVRLPDFYTRLHAPQRRPPSGGEPAGRLRPLLQHSGVGISLHEVLVTLFLFITAPASAHLLSRAALHLRLKSLAPVPGEGREREGAT